MKKYKDVKPGEVFFFQDNWSYPKCKNYVGHVDLKDNVRGQMSDNEMVITIQEIAELQDAARKLLSTFKKYSPGTDYGDEMWWKPNPAATMAQRDEALDTLAALLVGGK